MGTRNEQFEHLLNVIERSAQYLRRQYEAEDFVLPPAEDAASMRQAAITAYALCASPRPRVPEKQK